LLSFRGYIAVALGDFIATRGPLLKFLWNLKQYWLHNWLYSVHNILYQLLSLNSALINKTNSVDLSPQANYTDWATVTSRRNLVPTFVGCRVVSATDHLRLWISVF
jgi:hypothetical protein